MIAGMMPCRLLPENRGYGIPLAAEWAELPSIAVMESQREHFYELREVFVEALKKEHGDLYERYAGAEQNVGYFLRESARLPAGSKPE